MQFILYRARLNLKMAWAALWSNGMTAATLTIADGTNNYEGVFLETRKRKPQPVGSGPF